MNYLATINIGKAKLGMEDDDYRDFLKLMTGKDSLRRMTEGELKTVLNGMKDRGFKVGFKAASNKAYVRQIYALWRSCYELKIIKNRSREALRTFVQDRSNVTDVEFLDEPQARPIIETLKQMERRGKANAA